MALTRPATETHGWSATTVALSDSPATDPLAWFTAAPPTGERWFWEIPARGVSWVGIGVAEFADVQGRDRFGDAARVAQYLFDDLVVDAPADAPPPRLAAGFGFFLPQIRILRKKSSFLRSEFLREPESNL